MRAIAALALLVLSGCAPAYAHDTMTTVAMTLWGEARSESYAAKYAAASVIYNRANGNPAKMQAVCLSRKQFSCWRKRVFIQTLPDLKKPLDRKAWRDCVALASLLVDGQFTPDNTAKHYHESSIKPVWAKDIPRICMAGSHIFYR